MRIKSIFLLLLVIVSSHQLAAQNLPHNIKKSQPSPPNLLYQFGIADAFVGGLYRGTLPAAKLKANGDFGLGAPDMLDGELTMYKGKLYQTKANGQTAEAPDSLTTSLMFVTFFKAGTVFRITAPATQAALFQQIETYLKNKNGMYAIRITGTFNHIKTRAFLPFTKEPFPPLATILDKQRFFESSHTKGVLIGYKIPGYLAGVNIEGYHFHFLSDQFNQGGHSLDFSLENAQVEIAEMNGFKLDVARDKAFMDYNFKGTNNADLEKVEKGHE
jgi:acetolactate decarboxylase